MSYRAYPSYDTALVDLVTIDPQPHSVGVQYSRTTRAADGSLLQEGPFVILEWNLLQSDTEYQTVLDYFGVLSSLTSPVTVYVRSEIFTFTRYNGIANRPEVGKSLTWEYMPRNIQLTITDLTQLVEP